MRQIKKKLVFLILLLCLVQLVVSFKQDGSQNSKLEKLGNFLQKLNGVTEIRDASLKKDQCLENESYKFVRHEITGNFHISKFRKIWDVVCLKLSKTQLH